MHFGLLNPLDETVATTAKRTAQLYSFNKQKYDELKTKGFQLEF